jgi:hypothetical protein
VAAGFFALAAEELPLEVVELLLHDRDLVGLLLDDALEFFVGGHGRPF